MKKSIIGFFILLFISIISYETYKINNNTINNYSQFYSGKNIFDTLQEVPSSLNDNRPYRTASDFQKLVYKQRKIKINYDYYFNYGVVIDKPTEIDLNGKTFYFKNVTSAFTLHSNNITIKNGTVKLINTKFFIQSSTNSDRFSQFKNLKISNMYFTLESESSLNINYNNILFKNNIVKVINGKQCSLLNIKTNNSLVENNIFYNYSCLEEVLFKGNAEDNIIIDSNIFYSQTKHFKGLLNISNYLKSFVKNNLFYNYIEEPKFFDIKSMDDNGNMLSEDEILYMKGSTGIMFYQTKLKEENNIYNVYNKYFNSRSLDFKINEEDIIKESLIKNKDFNCKFIKYFNLKTIQPNNILHSKTNC